MEQDTDSNAIVLPKGLVGNEKYRLQPDPPSTHDCFSKNINSEHEHKISNCANATNNCNHVNGVATEHLDVEGKQKTIHRGENNAYDFDSQSLNSVGSRECMDKEETKCEDCLKSSSVDPSGLTVTKEVNEADHSLKICDLTLDEGQPDILNGINYVVYESEHQMPDIMRLITKDLSEPYSIYTYRYFIHNWPKLCFLAMDNDTCVGAIVCKLDLHKKVVRRGYIAMLAVDKNYRRRKIGSHLVLKAIRAMIADDCDEVVLETEITNKGALKLYENLGFVRDKRLFRYYLNGVDALRLKLWLR